MIKLKPRKKGSDDTNKNKDNNNHRNKDNNTRK